VINPTELKMQPTIHLRVNIYVLWVAFSICNEIDTRGRHIQDFGRGVQRLRIKQRDPDKEETFDGRGRRKRERDGKSG
jgi:hypothetical protein